MAGIWDDVNTNIFNPEKPNAPGVLSDVRRASGQFVSGVGSTLRDLGAEELGRGMEQYGTGVTRRNPSEIQSFEDVLSRPFTTAREAVGEVVPQVGLAVGGTLAGRAVGGLLGAPLGPLGIMAGQQVGGVVGGLLPIAAQTYGGIRAEQRTQGIDDRPRALGATIPAAALERLGAERIAGKLVGQGTQFLARETGESLWKAIGKQAIRGGLEETITEVPQTALERYGAYKPLTGPEAFDEYGVAGAKAFLGGGAIRGGLSAVAGTRKGLDEESDLTQPLDTTTRPDSSQFVTQDQTVGLKKFIDETTGVVRPSRKDYAKQFEAAFNEPSGQFVADAATGVERELTVGELMQRGSAAMDLTQDKPADTAAAATAATNVATTRDPRDVFLRDELKVTPNNNSRQLFTLMEEQGIDPTSPTMVPVWNYAAAKYMTPSRLVKATELMDAAIIESRKEAPSGTGISTVQQPAGGVGVGGPVVQGGLGDAGRPAPVAGSMGGGAPAAGAPLQQAGILPSTAGQPSTPVTTGAPSGPQASQTIQAAPQGQTTTTVPAAAQVSQPLAPGQFRRAPRPMTVLEAARATPTQVADAPPAPDIIGQIFGEDDADIIRGFLQGRSSTELAAEAKAKGIKGRGEQMIRNKIAGEMAVRNEWPKKIAAAKQNFGYTDEQIQQALEASMAPDADTRSEVEREMNLGRANLYGARMSETEAIEAGLEGSVKSAGAGSSAVKGFTKLQKEIDAMYKRLETEKDPMVLAYVTDRLTVLTEKVEQLEDNIQAKIRATAGVGDADGEADLVATAQEAEQKPSAVSDADAAKEAAAAKIRAEREAKLQADRNGLAVGDTVKNPKLGTGVVKSFAGDGDATTVTVEFQSGQTKELSVKLAKLEKTDAVQVKSPAGVSVQSEAKAGQGVGTKVRRAKKPAAEGKAQVPAVILTEAEQAAQAWDVVAADFPEAPKFTDLTKAQQQNFIDFGPGNWERGDVELELTKMARAAAPTQRAIGREPVTIDVEARVVEETVAPQVAKLPAPQVTRLENHYGVKQDSPEFLAKVKADVVLYATKGAEAVAGAIRDIIKSIHAGVLSVAMIFNPTAVSQIEAFVVIPQETQTTTQQVLAELPAEVKGMSEAGKQAYATLIPALKGKIGDKFVTIADKPSGRIFVFKANGDLVLQQKALFGLAKGDLYKGNNDLKQNRVTPAGLFGINVIDAAKGGAAATTAGDYDFGKVFALDDPDATVTFMHSVWLKESDAAKRAAALKNDSAADSRYSFGCINVDKETFKDMVGKYSNQMDGSKLFVVPDVQSTVNDFITGNVANDRLVREGVQPVTKTTTTPVKSATKAAGVDRTVAAKDEEVGGMKFGKEGDIKPAVAKNPYTAKELLVELKDFIRADIPGRKLMVVDSIEDLLRSPDKMVRAVGAGIALEGAYGVAVNGRAYLIANRIQKGAGRAKFMHEVGAHLGLEKLLPKAQYDKLTQQIINWAKKDDGSIESELALNAVERVQAAGTKQEDRRSEMLAYFIEEAMEAGIDPIAGSKSSSALTAWFRTLWAAFKTAARRLGMKPESMNAQDVVNLAFGAARLEINGTWHGTAADFRKFSNAFMGTGEGAQAYGWGTYLAQRTGIAKGYWSADIDRKTANPTATYDGRPLKDIDNEIGVKEQFDLDLNEEEQALSLILPRLEAELAFGNNDAVRDTLRSITKDSSGLLTGRRYKQASEWFNKNYSKFKVAPGRSPEGTLMRVDTAITPEETLDWDRPLSEQPAILEKLGMLMPEGLQEALADQYQQSVEDIGELTGEDLYRGLRFLEKNEGAVSEFWGIDDYVGQPGKKVASLFLDSMGIKGIQFLDAKSRGGKRVVNYDGTSYNWDKLAELARQAKDANESMKFNLLRDIAYDGLAKVKEETKQRVDEFVDRMFTNAKDSSARFGLKFDAEAELKDAQQRAAKTPWGERLAWLEANESIISTSKPTKTRNLVIFNDKNIFRVGSEVAADPQRMKFGSDMVELGKRGQLKEKAGKTRIDTANDRAIKLLEKAAKTKDPAEAEALRAEANALFSATAGKLSGMKFGKNMPSQGLIDRNIAKLPKMSQQPVKRVTEALGDLGGKYLDYAVFTNDLVKRAQALGLGAAKTFADRLAARNAKVSEEERKIEKIADRYASIEDDAKGSGPGSVNEFLFESTRTGKWGYGKYRDAKMGAAFDALGPKAQQFVKDVFAHGDATLSNKKKIVLEATNSEYDAMIKAAQDLVNTATGSKIKADAEKELAKLKAEKAATLKRFQTLFRIREGIPYAPIKRTGAYVVIGESAEYKAAKANKDTATVKKLESDPDHYHVSFVDTKWQARNLSDKLAEQGVFDSPQIVKRSESFDEAFSGEAMLPALTKMRAAVDRRAQDSTGKKDPTAGKLLNIINQLYLEALAEGSARKSEMRRRGVAGEVDMLQSFTQQGRADANFLASVEYEPKIQDALQQMRNQSRTGDRERKSEIFDELTQRYADSLEPKNNSFINGLTNMASKFFLASSPGYYLQNLTQPFMMSLPAMAGRHDYTKAAAELAKAYTELGPLFKDVKLFDQQFDFSKVPADVRKAINDLVNQGKIDIGLATEINEYKVDADGKISQFAQRLNKGMRMAVQKVEATNRLSTAIAAYRLEFARTKDADKATQYAADILTDTHGDYTAFNAPRAFNTQWGKVALQFRKFQLIQIAFYAKLFRDIGRTPEERAVALKTLAYSLGHTAVFAGMMGLPGYAAISAILGFFGDEDEPYDLTAEMRKALGPEWADMIMRGAPTVVGMDLSGKIGAGNMLSIMPFSDADLTTTSGQAEAVGTFFGGAALGMTSRVADGLLLMLKGDYYKGIERTMPKGVSDALKAARQGAEGMTRRNGDVVLPDSEISALDTVFTALGVPVAEQAVTYERQNRMRDITKNFTERTTRIKNDYAKAVREKDTAAMAEARTAWTKLQQTRQRNGLTPQPVSNLLKAPQEQKAREQRTVGGVQYREGQRKLAESVAEN